MKFSYNWLKSYIADIPNVETLHDVLTYHLTEVEDIVPIRSDGSIDTDTTSNEISDWIIDVNILPNRAHDLLSHRGLVFEIAGQLGLKFNDPVDKYKDILSKKEVQKTDLEIKIETENCRRYSARIIRGIKIGPSPEWVVKHLESIGQRSINNIVDATNLVMLNCGQPTHAFDLRKFKDHKIVIKNAKDGESLELVGRDKIVAKLKDTDLVIVNSFDETLALGGIKGGANSGIQDNTTDIVIEVGNFDPIGIRKTARRIGLLSDAAKRFENDLTPELCDLGIIELSALIYEMCPDAVMEEIVDMYPTINNFKNKNTITINSTYINNKIGGNILDNDIENIFKNYNFEYFKNGDNDFVVTIPSIRLDLVNKEDLVEEIGRIYGYDKLVPVLPNINFNAKDNTVYSSILDIRKNLISKGYREVMTYSLSKKGSVELARATKGKDFLRNNLSDGLKESYELNRLNAALLGDIETKIFEIGSVFKDGIEEIHVAYINKKEVKEYELGSFALSESTFEKSSDLLAVLGQTFPKSLSGSADTFVIWSQYPFITRDISVWVPEDFDVQVLIDIYKNKSQGLLALDPYRLDKFTKDGRTSYSYRLVFQAKDRTLVDTEVSEIMQKIEQNIKNISGVELR
jgi:phenylalanyl-tRNA synthetase beta chain